MDWVSVNKRLCAIGFSDVEVNDVSDWCGAALKSHARCFCAVCVCVCVCGAATWARVLQCRLASHSKVPLWTSHFLTSAGYRRAFEGTAHVALTNLLTEFEKRGQLVQQLLTVADGATSEKTRHNTTLRNLQRERDSLALDLKREKEARSKQQALQKV
jgi:hypothetical protein